MSQVTVLWKNVRLVARVKRNFVEFLSRLAFSFDSAYRRVSRMIYIRCTRNILSLNDVYTHKPT